MLPPVPVPVPVAGPPPAADARVAVVNSEGRLLVFPVAEVPELPRGKGNKLFGIPTKKAVAREELMTAVAVLARGSRSRSIPASGR